MENIKNEKIWLLNSMYYVWKTLMQILLPTTNMETPGCLYFYWLKKSFNLTPLQEEGWQDCFNNPIRLLFISTETWYK